MNHWGYAGFTMTKLPDGRLQEKDFITTSITSDRWEYIDNTVTGFALKPQVILSPGMMLRMKEDEGDELIGFPTQVEILKFVVNPDQVGYRGGVSVLVKPLAYPAIANGGSDEPTLIDSEALRCAYTGGTIMLRPNFEGQAIGLPMRAL